ncbi:sulfur carrier protein ThiS [Opitutales bacterium]|nr:sulfur carrier protein ThiS [Opitutales bacterium]
MKVFLNDKLKDLKDGTDLEGLSVELGLANMKGWAIAVNESIIPKEKHKLTTLQDGDRVLLIQATQGG